MTFGTSIIHPNDKVDAIKKYVGQDEFHNAQLETLATDEEVRWSQETNYTINDDGKEIETTVKAIFRGEIEYLPVKSEIVKDNETFIVESCSRPPGLKSALYNKVLCRKK